MIGDEGQVAVRLVLGHRVDGDREQALRAVGSESSSPGTIIRTYDFEHRP